MKDAWFKPTRLSAKAGLGARMPRQGIPRLLTGPLMIIPQGLLVAIAVGMFMYEPPEIHGHLEQLIFLQGNTDLGGGCLFAGTIALYIAFGFTSAWYLTLSLDGVENRRGFWPTILFVVDCWVRWKHRARRTTRTVRARPQADYA